MKAASRFALKCSVLALGAVTALSVPAGRAYADSLRAGYSVTLAGMSVGDASLTVSSTATSYRANLAMRLSGIAGLLTGARGAAVSTGAIVNSRPKPLSYAITTTNGTASRTVRMVLNGGAVARIDIKPPLDQVDDRVPVTAAQKAGVMDPISALVMPAPRPDAPLDPAGCDRKLAVFDGIARFDVDLTYARKVDANVGGYSGPAIVCSARYIPISGHRTSVKSTAYMAENHDMEIMLAPVAGAGVLVPLKIAVRTMFGMLEIEANGVRATRMRVSAAEARAGTKR